MQMDVAYAVQEIVERFLPRFSDEQIGLYVPIEAKVGKYHDNGKETRHFLDIHLIFHRPSNYTKVFWYQEIDSFKHLREIAPDAWTLESDHDSCWSSDGLSSPLNKYWWELLDKFPKKYTPKDLSNFVHFGMLGCKLIKVSIERVPGDPEYTKKYKVHAGQELPIKPLKLSNFIES